jgi:hypothetical protein
MLTGAAELLGMACGAMGLAISGVMALVQFVRERYAALGSDD